MTILAIDPGSRCGWALLSPRGQQLLFGTWDIRPRRGESPGMRYVRLRGQLEIVTASGRPELVAYEQAHNRGGAATEYAHGAVATLQAWCAEKGIEHVAVHSGELKKWATGSGKAAKSDMILAAGTLIELWDLEAHPPDVENHDEADAVCIAVWALATISACRPPARRRKPR